MSQSDNTDYRFSEDKYLEEITAYIDATYKKHYAANGESEKDHIQTFELISKDKLRGLHFALSSILKYADRAEYKNQTRSDIMKIIHYGLLSLYSFDRMKKQQKDIEKNEAV